MKAEVTLFNPVLFLARSASLLAIGFLMGKHFPNPLSAACLILLIAVCKMLKDAALILMVTMAAIKAASSGKHEDSPARSVAEQKRRAPIEPYTMPVVREVPAESGVPSRWQNRHDYLNRGIEELELSVRAHYALREAGIGDVRELVQFSEEELLEAGVLSVADVSGQLRPGSGIEPRYYASCLWPGRHHSSDYR